MKLELRDINIIFLTYLLLLLFIITSFIYILLCLKKILVKKTKFSESNFLNVILTLCCGA